MLRSSPGRRGNPAAPFGLGRGRYPAGTRRVGRGGQGRSRPLRRRGRGMVVVVAASALSPVRWVTRSAGEIGKLSLCVFPCHGNCFALDGSNFTDTHYYCRREEEFEATKPHRTVSPPLLTEKTRPLKRQCVGGEGKEEWEKKRGVKIARSVPYSARPGRGAGRKKQIAREGGMRSARRRRDSPGAEARFFPRKRSEVGSKEKRSNSALFPLPFLLSAPSAKERILFPFHGMLAPTSLYPTSFREIRAERKRRRQRGRKAN